MVFSDVFPMFRFELGDGRTVTSAQVLEHLVPRVQQDRLEKIQQVVAGRTFGIVPLLEGVYDKGNIGAVARSVDALGYVHQP